MTDITKYNKVGQDIAARYPETLSILANDIKYNTRIAPAPSGAFHLGTARTTYINYLAARASGGKFILRLDDTNQERNKPEWTQLILDSLGWLGLDYDEIHYQSGRTEIYKEIAEDLLFYDKAFKADNGAIILKGPVDLPASFHDTIAGNIAITDTNREQINDKVVLIRGNGNPTYQFCSVVDDFLLNITNIIRGVDHITNTPKQITIWDAVDYCWCKKNKPEHLEIWADLNTLPLFTHIGLVFKDGKKLSKRDGAASLIWYKEQGYKPAAVLNWLLLLGWSLKVPRGATKEHQKLANEPISKDVAIELFFKGTLKNSPCQYSIDKLNWLQKRY